MACKIRRFRPSAFPAEPHRANRKPVRNLSASAQTCPPRAGAPGSCSVAECFRKPLYPKKVSYVS
jgi:hypothetical protein